MKRKPIKVEFLALAMLVLITAGAVGLVVRPVRDPDIRHRAALGDVVWNHELHARMKGLTCQVCHHTSRPGVTEPDSCVKCHKQPPREQQGRVMMALYKDLTAPEPTVPPPPPPKPKKDEGPEAMVAYHGKCVGCHQAMKQGPLECRDCHAQRFSGPHDLVEWDHRMHSRQMDVTCESCHHPVKIDGKEVVKNQSCRVCHENAAALGTDMSTPAVPEHKFSTHKNCGVCHTEQNPASSAPDCIACHQKMKPAEEGTPPPIEEAIHRMCFDCHNEKINGLTPRTSGASECTDCHRQDPSFINTVFGPVLWPHEAHAQEYECKECHHERAGQPEEPFMSCSSCHNDKLGGTRIDARMPISASADAAHEQCIGCHTEKKRGPVDCDACHSRDVDISVFHTETGRGTATWDHRFHAIGLAFACQECHHNMKSRDGVFFTVCKTEECPPTAGEVKKCSACHLSPEAASAAASVMNAKMNLPDALCATCVGCHKKLSGPADCEELTTSRGLVPPTMEEGNE